MVLKVFIIVAIVAYVAVNAIVAKFQTAVEMKRDFIDGQCLVGKVCANIFYAPAWILKALRAVVLAIIA